MPGRTIAIHYRRPPDREEIFRQTLVAASADVVVTYMAEAGVKRPLVEQGRTILEPGAPVVWFTYPGLWHDIGRFHLRDGTFTGYYANLLTPVSMHGDRWETTDLFLDVWQPVGGEPGLLDVDELEEAERLGWVTEEVSTRVRRHAESLMADARAGRWPPAHVEEWTLPRVRDHLHHAS